MALHADAGPCNFVWSQGPGETVEGVGVAGEGGGAEDVDFGGVEEVGDMVGCGRGEGDAVREERPRSVGEGWTEGFCHVEMMVMMLLMMGSVCMYMGGMRRRERIERDKCDSYIHSVRRIGCGICLSADCECPKQG